MPTPMNTTIARRSTASVSRAFGVPSVSRAIGPSSQGRTLGGMDPTIVLYDEDCGFCRWTADKLRGWDRHQRLRFASIQSSRGQALLASLPPEVRLDSAHVVTAGRVRSGGAAVAPVLRE